MLHAVFEAIRGLPEPLVVAILSAAPVSELRGGIIVGYLAYDMPLVYLLPLAIVCNVVSVVPVLLWFNPVADWLVKRGRLTGLVERLRGRARAKKPMVDKYGVYAVAMFVAIPLPVTGAWTGALVASVFEMDFWRALGCVAVGVCIAAAVVTILCAVGVYTADLITG